MAGGIVSWHFFDVESGRVPEGCTPSILPGGGEGRIIVLAATPFAQKGGWGSKAAVAIAKDWAGSELSIFLMDLGLETPTLHELLGLPNEEGVSDAFLYGASVQNIAQPAMDGAFFFASAGTVPGDTAEVLGHSRWNDLAGGFSEADATLLLFLPTDVPGAGKILSRASDIIFLSAQGESADAHLGPASIKVVSLVGPMGSPPEELGDTLVAEEPADDGLGAGLDLAGEFGADEPEEESPSFEFGGGMVLADGFGEDEPSEEPEEEVAGFGTGSEDAPDFGGELALEGAEDADGEMGDDLVIGAEFSGGLEVEDSGPEDFEEPAPSVPDFGSDFAEMPDDEGEFGGGDFGGELVQGPDFGEPGPGGDEPETVEAPPEPPVGEAPAEEGAPPRERPRPAPKRRSPPKKKFPVGLVVTLVVVLGVLGAAAGTAFGPLNVPGLTFLKDYFGEIPDPPLTLAGPEPNEPTLRFSLLLFTYDEEELADAGEMVDALRSRLPNLLFTLVPETVGEEGTLTYALLVGPALDRIDAENLRVPLGQVLDREDPESWPVRETPRAFYLGERETLEDAQAFLDGLEAEGIPGYILHSTYSDGTEAYVIFSGAYQGVLDARPLTEILHRSGYRGQPLVERRGQLPG
ncbi:hypothetical protein ACFL5A_00520 [Gemmatimonadota bacterium]